MRGALRSMDFLPCFIPEPLAIPLVSCLCAIYFLPERFCARFIARDLTCRGDLDPNDLPRPGSFERAFSALLDL